MPSASTAVRDRLRRELLEGSLEPGAWINMTDLTRQLGVSATPVREALIALEQEGLVEAAHGRGFVASPFDPHEIRALYPMIWMLETSALREAPPRASDLERLREMNASLAEAASDPWGAIEADNRWHDALLGRFYNPVFEETLAELKVRVARYEHAYMRESGRVGVSVGQHGQILDALGADELEAAVEALRANWETAPDTLLPWLESKR